jgi:predicted aminopeptidase
VTRRRLLFVLGALALLVVAGSFTACSPIYVIRAGIAEAKILSARRPIPEVILDPATDARTRDMLTFAREARTFAMEELELDVGDAYTSFTQLDSDTLALVLSAAYPDRLQSVTWWFPIVGHVPYRGYFSESAAREEQEKLDREGLDTLLRPTGAFSTLGWFADPLLSTLLRSDEIELVETLIHELSHNHLWVPGQVRFNESFAVFVGRAGAVEFFCGREGGGPDTVKCARAEARWRDVQRYSVFIDGLIEELQAVYADSTLDTEAKLVRRQEVWEAQRAVYENEVAPSFESLRFGRFVLEPLNNAVLLGQMRYYHRIGDFAALLEREGSVRAAVGYLKAGVEREGGADAFDLLPGDARSLLR